MAKRLNAESGNASHDVTNRNQIILSTFATVLSLDEQIRKIMEDKIEPLKAKKTKAFRNAKTDLEMPIKALKMKYKEFSDAQTAESNEDDGASFQDSLREIHDALYPGGQLDFLKAFELTQTASKKAG